MQDRGPDRGLGGCWSGRDADTWERVAYDYAREVGWAPAALMAINLTNLGEGRSARRWWRTAARTADQTGDRATAALVRGRAAVFSLYADTSRLSVVEAAEEASEVGNDAPCGPSAAASGVGRTAVSTTSPASSTPAPGTSNLRWLPRTPPWPSTRRGTGRYADRSRCTGPEF